MNIAHSGSFVEKSEIRWEISTSRRPPIIEDFNYKAWMGFYLQRPSLYSLMIRTWETPEKKEKKMKAGGSYRIYPAIASESDIPLVPFCRNWGLLVCLSSCRLARPKWTISPHETFWNLFERNVLQSCNRCRNTQLPCIPFLRVIEDSVFSSLFFRWGYSVFLFFLIALVNFIPSYAWGPPPTAGCRGSTCSITFNGRVVRILRMGTVQVQGTERQTRFARNPQYRNVIRNISNVFEINSYKPRIIQMIWKGETI
jgi:hypothetical protein